MPIRTCLVTGKKADSSAFFRFTIVDGVLTFDTPKIKHPGRGGYVIQSKEAIYQLPKLQKKISHFLKKSTTIPLSTIESQIKLISDHLIL